MPQSQEARFPRALRRPWDADFGIGGVRIPGETSQRLLTMHRSGFVVTAYKTNVLFAAEKFENVLGVAECIPSLDSTQKCLSHSGSYRIEVDVKRYRPQRIAAFDQNATEAFLPQSTFPLVDRAEPLGKPLFEVLPECLSPPLLLAPLLTAQKKVSVPTGPLWPKSVSPLALAHTLALAHKSVCPLWPPSGPGPPPVPLLLVSRYY